MTASAGKEHEKPSSEIGSKWGLNNRKKPTSIEFSNLHCYNLTFSDKEIVFFVFGLSGLLSVFGLVALTGNAAYHALGCERSRDVLGRQVTLLQRQVHCLRYKSGRSRCYRTCGWRLNRLVLSVNTIPHLSRVSQGIDCLLMRGSLQAFAIYRHDAVTWAWVRRRMLFQVILLLLLYFLPFCILPSRSAAPLGVRALM